MSDDSVVVVGAVEVMNCCGSRICDCGARVGVSCGGPPIVKCAECGRLYSALYNTGLRSVDTLEKYERRKDNVER